MTDYQKQLVTDNHNLIYRFLQKEKLNMEDWYDLAAIGMCKAAKTFNEGTSKFSTYAFKCMFNEVYSEKKKELRQRTIPQNEILYYNTEYENESGNKVEFIDKMQSDQNVENDCIHKVALRNAFNKMKEKHKPIISLFLQGYKQVEIMKIAGCSQPHVSRVMKKFVDEYARCWDKRRINLCQ